jgi:hypothetical protein
MRPYRHLLSLDLDRRRFGDLDLLRHLFLDCELSRLLCSSSFLFPAMWEATWSGRSRGPFPDGVPTPLDVSDLVADTKSTVSRGAFDFCCSLALNICFCEAFNSSKYAHSGNTTGTAMASGSVDLYCSSSLMPAKSSCLCKWPGSFRTDESSKRWLKCTPSFLLSLRKFANFLVACCGGDPGGEGGMSKLGTVGKVKFCIMARLDVYGEPGGASLTEPSSSRGSEAVGPGAGPLIGAVAATGCVGGVGSGRGCGAGAAASVGVFVNSISVAIKVPHTKLGDLHLSWARRWPPPRHYFRTLFRAFCCFVEAELLLKQ